MTRSRPIRHLICEALHNARVEGAHLLIEAYGIDGAEPRTLRELAGASNSTPNTIRQRLAVAIGGATTPLAPLRPQLRALLDQVHAASPIDLGDAQSSLEDLDGWPVESLLRFAAEVMIEAPPVRIERERRGNQRVAVLWPRELPDWTHAALRHATSIAGSTGAAAYDSIARILRGQGWRGATGEDIARVLPRLPGWRALGPLWGAPDAARNRPLQALMAILGAALEPLPFATLYAALLRLGQSVPKAYLDQVDPLAPPHVLRALLELQDGVRVVAGGGFERPGQAHDWSDIVEHRICRAIVSAGGIISRSDLQDALPEVGGAVLNAALYSCVHINPLARGFYALRGGLLEPRRLARAFGSRRPDAITAAACPAFPYPELRAHERAASAPYRG